MQSLFGQQPVKYCIGNDDETRVGVEAFTVSEKIGINWVRKFRDAEGRVRDSKTASKNS